MTETSTRRRGVMLLAVAAVAGILAGTVAVYVRAPGEGNGGAFAAKCADALAIAKRVAPLATGEIAAFRPATGPESLSDLAFRKPDGTATSLAAFGGRVVLVNLWATWCVPCRAEMPALDRLQSVMGGKTFAVAAINVDVQNPQRAKDFLSEIGVTNLAFYSDPTMGVFNDLKRRGLAIGLPTTLLIDGNGCRIGIVEGPALWDSVEAKALVQAALTGTTS
jgi:thiol-disulfide isomerase/thioredoxin